MYVFVLLVSTMFTADGPEARLRLGHYSSGDGLRGLVLDRTADPVLLRLDGSDEVVALTPEPAAYGGVALVRDDGIRLLRVDQSGSVLLAIDGARDPVALFRDGDVPPLKRPGCPAGGPPAAAESSASALAALGVEGGVAAEAEAIVAHGAWVVCLTIANARRAIARVAETSFGARAVQDTLTHVLVRAGAFPGASVDDRGALTVTVKPDAGWRGVVSSHRIEEALLEGL